MNRFQFTQLACALTAALALTACNKAPEGTTSTTPSSTTPSTGSTSPPMPASAASR